MNYPIASYRLFCFIDVEKRKRVLDSILSKLSDRSFDAIAVSGLGGYAFGSVVAYLLNKPIVFVRKHKSDHSGYMVEGIVKFNSFVVIDDCIETGECLNRILDGVKKLAPDAKCVGVCLYNQGNFDYPQWSHLEILLGGDV